MTDKQKYSGQNRHLKRYGKIPKHLALNDFLDNPDVYLASMSANEKLTRLHESIQKPHSRNGFFHGRNPLDYTTRGFEFTCESEPISGLNEITDELPEGKTMADIGKKFDSGKPRYSLIPAISLKEIVIVLTFGAVKYGDDNWMHVANAKQRYTDALYRHIEDWRNGEKIDPESGRHHLAHAACCILFLIWFDLKD